jgi:hypothetical protein
LSSRSESRVFITSLASWGNMQTLVRVWGAFRCTVVYVSSRTISTSVCNGHPSSPKGLFGEEQRKPAEMEGMVCAEQWGGCWAWAREQGWPWTGCQIGCGAWTGCSCVDRVTFARGKLKPVGFMGPKNLLFRYILCQSVWPLTTSWKVQALLPVRCFRRIFTAVFINLCTYFTKDRFIYARCLEKLSTNKLAIIRLNGKKCIDELDIV